MAMVDSAYQRPSNVAVFFTVDGPNGEPIPGLEADDFRIYEDGRIVSIAESRQTIVNPEVAAEHYTLVLVDMSGSVSESDQVPLIEAAAQELVAQLQDHQRVAIYAFDGSEEIYRITPFTGSAGAVSAGAGRLSGFRPRDPSTNLHGAVVAAIEELDRELERSQVPLRFGTVVVFTDGTSYKVKRIRRDPRARVAPCDVRGGLRGPFHEAVAELLEPGPDEDRAYRLLTEKYGWQKRLLDVFSRLGGRTSRRKVIRISFPG